MTVNDMNKIPSLSQRQDSLYDQMMDLYMVAIKLGMYDAADFIQEKIQLKDQVNLVIGT